MRGSYAAQTRTQYLFYGTSIYNWRIMKNNNEIFRFSQSKQAQFRLKVIEFYDQYGIKATKDAYNISRATIFRWRKRYLDSKKELTSLIPVSRAPKNRREMMVSYKIIELIQNIREDHPKLGKEKIKPALDDYCKKERLKTISVSTIGKVISRYCEKIGKVKFKRGKKSYKDRIRSSPKVNQFGYIQIDTIHKFTDGIKTYIYNAIDLKLRY